MFTEPGTARQEAERLVATVLAAATLAANANPQWSTGSSECCVCPLCKVIAAVRDPDPQMVERVATGAGDLAAGLASFLRHVATSSSSADSAWSSATSSPTNGKAGGAQEKAAPEKAGREKAATPAKKVVKKAVKKTAAKKAG